MNASVDLNIKISETNPPIWRLVRVDDALTFAEVHALVLRLFDWPEPPSHWFHVREERVGAPGKVGFSNERKITLAERIRGKRFLMHYYYGEEDEWEVEMSLVQRLDAPVDGRFQLLDGARKIPPASIEGPVELAALQQALFDSVDPDHAMAKGLLGAANELESFDLQAEAGRLLRS